ncbi:hypothetical protein KCP71_18945 [Salmonella enterica subsp. enterica]|nr:hypothetical protein KCP71_18945 [Salmonella enterica subsp. enterica]
MSGVASPVNPAVLSPSEGDEALGRQVCRDMVVALPRWVMRARQQCDRS